MAEKLGQYETEIRRTEQLQTLGKIGAGMAHQLRNAATGGRIAIELHQRECPLGPSDESLQVALRQFRLMESFLQRFLALGKPTGGQRTRGSAVDLVAEVLDLLRPTAQHFGVRLESAESEEPLTLQGDQEALRQLLSNLVLNACEAAAEVGDVRPQVVIELARASDGFGVIRVYDTGPGPSAALQARLFEPFVSGKPSGTGLGLFAARQIAQAHGGDVSWQRRDGTTCFSFTFPLDQDRGQRSDRG
jgi:signal transduction histidine kinase